MFLITIRTRPSVPMNEQGFHSSFVRVLLLYIIAHVRKWTNNNHSNYRHMSIYMSVYGIKTRVVSCRSVQLTPFAFMVQQIQLVSSGGYPI